MSASAPGSKGYEGSFSDLANVNPGPHNGSVPGKSNYLLFTLSPSFSYFAQASAKADTEALACLKELSWNNQQEPNEHNPDQALTQLNLATKDILSTLSFHKLIL